jgi:hypothetical protein
VGDERFHLTLTAEGVPVTHGWWGRRPTAEHQYRSWIGSWCSIDGARARRARRTAALIPGSAPGAGLVALRTAKPLLTAVVSAKVRLGRISAMTVSFIQS